MKRYKPLLENVYGIKPLIVIAHSGTAFPYEIKTKDIVDNYRDLLISADLYTEELYNYEGLFRYDFINFVYHRSFLDCNEPIDQLDDCVPTKHWRDDGSKYPIYKNEPSIELRKYLAQKYIIPFHNKIKCTDKTFILDCHSSNIGDIGDDKSKFTADLEIADRQVSKDKQSIIRTAPEGYLEEYLKQLDKQLRDFTVHGKRLTIKYNTPFTVNTYGDIEGQHGWDGIQDKGTRAPLLMQEINEDVYTDRQEEILDYVIIEELRRRMGRAIFDTLIVMEKYKR